METIIGARKFALIHEKDKTNHIASHMVKNGLGELVLSMLTPQELMLNPEILEAAHKTGVQHEIMMHQSYEVKDIYHTPFTEDDIDKLRDDVDSVFVEMTKHKRKVLKEEHKWTDDEAFKKDVSWDTDISYCKQQWGGWEIHEIENKMKMLSDFMGVDINDLPHLFAEDPDDYIGYELFYVFMRENKLELPVHVNKFVRSLMNDGFIEDFCSEYGEPGYTKAADSNVIITANWNGMSNGVYEIIEENGYDPEWSDEWICDDNTDKIFRSSPDGYEWEPSYFIEECEVLGIADNEEIYIETMINEPNKLLSGDVDLKKYGFIDLEDFCRETGWYGRVEDPKKVFDHFRDEYSEMVVQTCSIGQFSVKWRVWGRNIDD